MQPPKQQMVDAQARVAGEGASHVVPEVVDRLFGVQMPKRIRPALGEQLAVGFACFGKEQSVVHPAFRLVGVQLGRDDVVVAREDGRASEQ